METKLRARILALVSRATGVKSEKLRLGTTLSRDLGMEGDDAVTDLFRDWKFYFSSEGVPLTTALLVVIPAVVLAIFLERFFPYLHGMVALGISVLLWLAALVQWNRWRNKDSPQISIEDLVQSASSGKWTKVVPEKIVRRMNKPKFYDRFVAR